MPIATRLWSFRSVKMLSGLAILAAPICTLFFTLMPTEGANAPSAAVQALSHAAIGAIDPASVAGSKACIECHKSEYGALMASKHNDSLKLITGGSDVPKYIAAVGGNRSVCLQCHATPQAGGVQAAVSCESCHGGSVGNPEWLKLHATKGITNAQRKQCDQAGMIRAVNVYAIAKNCTGCHLVSNTDLVNVGGHPVTTKWSYELVGGSSGEVRHNFHENQKVNAEAPSLWLKNAPGAKAGNRKRLKYVVGMLVDLEVTTGYLKDVPKAAGKKRFAKGHAKRLKSITKDLKAAAKALGSDAPAELTAAVKAIEDIGKVSSFNFKSQAGCGKASPIIAASAKAIAEKYDGSKMAALDAAIKKNKKTKPR